jgi:hypothetical protein
LAGEALSPKRAICNAASNLPITFITPSRN